MKATLQKSIKIGISGKRDIASPLMVYEKIKESISTITKREKTKSFVAYSAMAKGADTIFAEVVKNEFNQEVKVVLPFDSTEYEKDFTEADDLKKYKHWVNTVGISEVVTKSPPLTNEQRNEAYLSAGKSLVDTCDYMVIVWDGLKPRGNGGTAEILGYASQCSTIKGIELITVRSDRTDVINDEIVSLLQASDKDAVRLKKQYETVWIISILFGWLTALCFSATLSFHLTDFAQMIFSFLELTLIFTVFGLIGIVKKKRLHSNLLVERLRAEKLRLLNTYYNANLPVTISEITQKDDPKLSNIAEKVNAAGSRSYQSKWYKYYAIKTLIEDQRMYHYELSEKVIGNIPKKLNLLKTIIYATWLIILFSHFFSLCLSYFNIYIPVLSDFPYPHELGRFFSIILPASYAAIEGFLFFKDWENLKMQANDMQLFLSKKQKQLFECQQKNDDYLPILNSVSNAMLMDNKNWISLLSKKETPHPIL